MVRTTWRRLASSREKWAPFVGVVAFLWFGTLFISDVAADGSVWNWFKVGLWVFVMAFLAWQCVNVIRRRPTPSTPPAVDPASVPAADVRDAIAATQGRIPAIKALRERHPGLGLKAAADLVDAADPDRDA
ncbi:hypothetical protein [Prescottella subtropica]|uniref:hypothetical protein n=1 Tax=Prescottella subtropica TaxID=2545757 RepID=UPI0010F612FA|nr:hypothetical protein [Prescottella subtropica]